MTEHETNVITMVAQNIKYHCPDLDFAILVFKESEPAKVMIGVPAGKHIYSIKDKLKELIADMESGKKMFE